MSSGSGTAPFEHDEPGRPAVRGFLHKPSSGPQDALVLTHGAGSNCKAPLLVAVADAFAAAGLTVLRCDLPYRQTRPHGPPFPGGAALDREGLRSAAAALRKIAPGRLFLGGHSYGGRQATMLAAEDASVADSLLLLSYPLHPPQKPQQLRTVHFPKLATPALFVQGSADPFGSLEEMTVDGASHDLAGKHRTGDALGNLAAAIAKEFLIFVQ
jgi:uncharacterized protein